MKKSFVTRALAVSLSAAMAFSLSSATSLTAPEAAAKKLAVNAKAVKISLKVGKSKTLQLKSYKTWNISKAKTNKKAVATVKKSGTNAKVKVTAKKAGKATITLTLKHKKGLKKDITKKVKVTVKKAATADTTPTDTTPTDTTPTTPTDSSVKVTPGALNISSVTAAKADTLVVSFSSVVASTGAVNITVKRGDSNVDVKQVTWNADSNTATVEMLAELAKGTYTVTATDGKDTTTGTVEVEARKVNEIVFKNNETALTGYRTKGDDSTKNQAAYIYYDVVDQYGDSMRENVNINWSGSVKVAENNREKGRLTVTKTDETAFTFSDKIYMTGVYSKTGVVGSITLNVGTEQGVNKIDYIGFVKKNSTEIKQQLPKNFKAGEYLLLYTAYDQNDCEMDAEDYIANNSLTILADNPLVIEKVEEYGKTVTIKGVEYCAATVVPGDNAIAGGNLTLKAISNKTGMQTEKNIVVGEFRILKSFVINEPDSTVADGEGVELKFTALDTEGQQMTNFKEIAQQSQFSKLMFTASVGELTLDEKEDGSAKLIWMDEEADAVWDAGIEDEVDRPVSLTAMVIGGESNNMMFYLQDKARPNAIADVNLNGVAVHESEQKISLSRFTFVDQYNRNMTNFYKEHDKADLITTIQENDRKNTRPQDDATEYGYVYDNGFFEASNTLGYNGLGSVDDYRGYKFSVFMEISDAGTSIPEVTAGTKVDGQIVNIPLKTNDNKLCMSLNSSNDLGGYKVNYLSTGSVKEPNLSFSIRKERENDKPETVGKKYTDESLSIVPMNKVSDFKMKSFDRFAIQTAMTDYDNGSEIENIPLNETTGAGSNQGTLLGYIATKDQTTGDYIFDQDFPVVNDQDVEITGTYNGKSVTIPDTYYMVGTDGVLATSTENEMGVKNISRVKAKQLQWKDLYDASSAKNTRKDASDTVEVTLYDYDSSKEKHVADDSHRIQVVKGTALISDGAPVLTTFAAADKVTIEPDMTEYTMNTLLTTNGAFAKDDALAKNSTNGEIMIKDQYGKEVFKLDSNKEEAAISYHMGGNQYDNYMKFEYQVENVKEAEGYVDGNFKVNNNSTEFTSIEGAELGDTFTLKITAKVDKTNRVANGANPPVGGEIVKTVQVTVGPDKQSYINKHDNFFTALDEELKTQVTEVLGNN